MEAPGCRVSQRKVNRMEDQDRRTPSDRAARQERGLIWLCLIVAAVMLVALLRNVLG